MKSVIHFKVNNIHYFINQHKNDKYLSYYLMCVILFHK